MPDILTSAQTSTPPLLPVRADVDLPFSSHATSLPQEPEPEPAIPPPVGNKKRRSKSLILAVLLFLLATLPLSVYFTSQQRQLADVRSSAQQGPYPCASTNTCVPARVECSDGGGIIVAGTCSSGRFCCDFGSGTNTPTPTPIRNPTPTPTPTTAPGSCGGNGQVCCPSNRTDGGNICNGNLYCNGSTCQTTAPANLCQGNQGSGQTAGTKCKIYRCGSRCNNGNQCNLGERIVDCGTTLGECGQIDWLDTNENYCGVKEQNCGGSCAGTTTTPPPGTGTPPPGNTPTPTPPPGNTPTPTPTTIPGGTCELIKIYDSAGADITLAIRNGTKKLAIGEEVTIATTKGNATKARFRIQGIADWAENDPAKTTATEYRLSINIPSTLTQSQGTLEVEVYVNGVWK